MNKREILFQMTIRRGITPRRLINFLKVVFSFFTKNTWVAGFPPILMVEPTNLCNLRCPLCPTGTGTLNRPGGIMPLNRFQAIMDEIGDYVWHLTLWNWGEPFLCDEVYDMIRIAHEKRIFIRISTNGHFLIEGNIEKLIRTGLDNLIVAIDGASEETFSLYRQRGDFEKVMGGLKKIISTRKEERLQSPFIELQFMIMRHNEHEIPLIQSIAKRTGVDKLTFKTVNIKYGPGRGEEKIEKFLPRHDNLSRYLPRSTRRKVYLKNKCYRLWFSTVINWDGEVVPCCYDADGSFSFGNIDEAGLKTVWNNSNYRQFREDVLKDKKGITLCKDCPGTLLGLTLSL